MASKRWRCSFCRTLEQPWGIEFEAETPQCPRCHASGMVIIPLENVHFLAPDPQGLIAGAGGRRYRIACSPEKANPLGKPATGLPSAVTCRRCQDTVEFDRAAHAEIEFAGAVLME